MTPARFACLGALALVAWLAGPAAADPYGEPPLEREGFAIGAALGPGLSRGSGELDHIQGTGGDFHLRLGARATSALQLMLELELAGYLEKEGTLEGGDDTTYTSIAATTLGGQLYLRQALWLRGGAGVVRIEDKAGQRGPVDPDSRRDGLALTGGGGADVFHRGRFALSIELSLTAAMFADGVVSHGALLLGLSWY